MFPQGRIQELQKSIDKMITDPDYHEDRSFPNQQFLPPIVTECGEPYIMVDQVCPYCDGSGKIYEDSECPFCYGTGNFIIWIYAGKKALK
jgi:hypothetical protein